MMLMVIMPNEAHLRLQTHGISSCMTVGPHNDRYQVKKRRRKESMSMTTPQPPKPSGAPDVPHGMDLLNRQGLNKGTAFTAEERSASSS
jgi:hypothetical protein